MWNRYLAKDFISASCHEAVVPVIRGCKCEPTGYYYLSHVCFIVFQSFLSKRNRLETRALILLSCLELHGREWVPATTFVVVTNRAMLLIL